MSRVGSGWVGSRGFQISRVGSGVKRFSSRTGRVGPQEVFKSRGSGRVGSGRVGSGGVRSLMGRVMIREMRVVSRVGVAGRSTLTREGFFVDPRVGLADPAPGSDT